MSGLVIFILAIAGSQSIEPKSDAFKLLRPESYVGAVVEYNPVPFQGSPRDIIWNNLKNYKEIIQAAAKQNVDILVFPEYGLTTLGIPRNRSLSKPFLQRFGQVGELPCSEVQYDEPDFVTKELSCAARDFAIYTVANVAEVAACAIEEGCPKDGVFHYNTNVAYDRFGRIISKYRKRNLYFEDQFDPGSEEQDESTFITDFGVEFGMFTCFDVIFYEPALRLVRQGIKNFLYPTAWVDELPFLTAVQAQALWSYSHDVNILASGYHQPIGGQMGSGIFSGKKGFLNYTYNPSSGTKLVTAQISTRSNFIQDIPQCKDTSSDAYDTQGNFHFWLKEDLSNYTSILVTEIFNEVCTASGFCCRLIYSGSKDKIASNLRVFAFDDYRSVARETDKFKWNVCAIVHCEDGTLESCTQMNSIPSNQHDETLWRLEGDRFNLGPETSPPGLNILGANFGLMKQTKFSFNYDSSSQSAMTTFTGESLSLAKVIGIIQRVYDGRLVEHSC